MTKTIPIFHKLISYDKKPFTIVIIQKSRMEEFGVLYFQKRSIRGPK